MSGDTEPPPTRATPTEPALTQRSHAPYAQEVAVLATQHGKLPLIGPPLWSTVRLTTRSVAVDTDLLGTFSGEVPRPSGPLQTAICKARLGMEATGVPLGLASEGTISDPCGLGVLPMDTELVVLVDDHRNITVCGWATAVVVATTATMAPGAPIDELLGRAQVPPHHLVVSPAGVEATGPTGLTENPWQSGTTKAVGDGPSLLAAIDRAAATSPDGRARVTTDLRAHLCPSRQPVIAAAARDLAQRLGTPCPECASPGWGIESVVVGLECAWCTWPTDEVAAHRWACPSCDATELRAATVSTKGDPGRCARCNP